MGTQAMAIGWVDIGLAAVVVVSMIVGLVRGLVFEMLSAVGWYKFGAHYGLFLMAEVSRSL